MEKRDVPSQVWPVAAAAVMGISSSAALARGVAGEAAPAAIACWRVAGASALNLATRRARRRVAALDRRDATLAARSGLLLAAHFLLFFEALRRTSVLRSTILVGLCPLWVGLADRIRGSYVPGRVLARVRQRGGRNGGPGRRRVRSRGGDRRRARRGVGRAVGGVHSGGPRRARASRARPNAYASPRAPRARRARGATRCGDSAAGCSSLGSLPRRDAPPGLDLAPARQVAALTLNPGATALWGFLRARSRHHVACFGAALAGAFAALFFVCPRT